MPDEPQRTLVAFLGGLLLLGGLSWLLDAQQPAIVAALRPNTGLVAAMALHILALLGVALLGLWLSLRLWQHPVRRRVPGEAGLLLLLATCLLVYQGANAAAHVLASRDLHAIGLALDGFPDAELRPLAPGTIRITGPLGPNLMRNFRAAEAASGPFARVEITSPGGLVAPALALAGLVERHGLTVVVRGECLSACVPIAVAAPAIFAEPDAVFGFHRVAPAVEVVSYRQEDLTPDMFAFLRRHGVPEMLLEQAAGHGADSMLLVAARDMVAMGIVNGVLAGRSGP